MKCGDLVRVACKGGRDQLSLGEVGIIVDIVTHTETYASAGCKEYIVLTAHGNEYKCWKGSLEVINESR